MKYFKYILILILLLISTLLYIQIDDYDNISSSLLHDNIQTKQNIEQLSQSIEELKLNSSSLQDKINKLYSIIDTKELEIELLEEKCKKQKLLLNENKQNENEVLNFE